MEKRRSVHHSVDSGGGGDLSMNFKLTAHQVPNLSLRPSGLGCERWRRHFTEKHEILSESNTQKVVAQKVVLQSHHISEELGQARQ